MSRRAFYWERQERRCYLGLDPKCVANDRALKSPVGATWEHVIPKSRKKPGSLSLLLLACHRCNTAKASRMPAPEQFELAIKIAREWFKATGGAQFHGPQLDQLEADYSAYRKRRAAEIERLNAEIDNALKSAAA